MVETAGVLLGHDAAEVLSGAGPPRLAPRPVRLILGTKRAGQAVTTLELELAADRHIGKGGREATPKPATS